MFKDRLDYIRQTFAPETEQLKKTRAASLDAISIYPEEGKFLQLLIKLGQVKKIVEIGTLNGYSTQWMADALPDDGHIWTIEKDEKRAAVAATNLSALTLSSVTLLKGDALTLLPTIEPHAPFDMVFIDADKLNYLHYLDWAEKNVRKGGIIVGDNTFLLDAVWKDEAIERVRETARNAMRDFNRRLADPQKYHSIMLPTEEGMTVGVKLF